MGAITWWTQPPVINRDCRHCQLFQYDEETQRVHTHGGKMIRRKGPPPCHWGKCKLGHYRRPYKLLWMNRHALDHWYRCRVVGNWPVDGLVVERAGRLMQVRELYESQRERERHQDFIGAVFTGLRRV